LDHAIEIEPKEPRHRVEKIIVYVLKGDHAGAQQAQQQARDEIPDFPVFPDPTQEPEAFFKPVIDWLEEHDLVDLVQKLLDLFKQRWPEVKWDAYSSEPPAASSEADAATAIAQGKKEGIQFGGYTWRVLDVQDGKALLITEKIIEKRPYNVEYTAVTWETCTLRAYLNGEFYNKFSAVDRARILETRNANPSNQWYGTNGGNATTDKVFLLSLDESVKYFGDSGDLKNQKRWGWSDGQWIVSDDGYILNDQYNDARIAEYGSEGASWWWLRSPGSDQNGAASVLNVGIVILHGSTVVNEGGVRPALWLNLES